MEENHLGLICGHITSFSGRNYGKPRITSVQIDDVPAEILIDDLQNASH
jgi:hypothetical protein